MALTKTDKDYLEKMFTANRVYTRVVADDLEDKINSKMKKLKSDIMNHIDTFAKEIKDNRDERTIQAHQIVRNTKRIEKLETKVLEL